MRHLTAVFRSTGIGGTTVTGIALNPRKSRYTYTVIAVWLIAAASLIGFVLTDSSPCDLKFRFFETNRGDMILVETPSGTRLLIDGGDDSDLAVQNLESEGYERVLRQRRNGTFTKAGWNHYGPGYFELDEQTGVLTSHGGMGLLWYSVREYGDFILELDFMTEVENANAGVFLRVPGPPSSDDYIYHSWEIQIDDASDGVHHTGAVYDAEAPAAQPPPGPGR